VTTEIREAPLHAIFFRLLVTLRTKYSQHIVLKDSQSVFLL